MTQQTGAKSNWADFTCAQVLLRGVIVKPPQQSGVQECQTGDEDSCSEAKGTTDHPRFATTGKIFPRNTNNRIVDVASQMLPMGTVQAGDELLLISLW